MAFDYIFHEKAQLEYETSVLWYSQRSLKTAKNFVLEVDSSIDLICKFPQRWPKKYKSFHELSLKKFPFTIVYTIQSENNLIAISSVYHQKRSPMKRYRK